MLMTTFDKDHREDFITILAPVNQFCILSGRSNLPLRLPAMECLILNRFSGTVIY